MKKFVVYFRDSSIPIEYEVVNIFTEGGLLRVVTPDGSVYFPLVNVHKIEEVVCDRPSSEEILNLLGVTKEEREAASKALWAGKVKRNAR